MLGCQTDSNYSTINIHHSCDIECVVCNSSVSTNRSALSSSTVLCIPLYNNTVHYNTQKAKVNYVKGHTILFNFKKSLIPVNIESYYVKTSSTCALLSNPSDHHPILVNPADISIHKRQNSLTHPLTDQKSQEPLNVSR